MRDAFSIKNRGKVCLFSEFTFLNRDIFDLFQLLRGSRSLERGIAMEARARQLIAKTRARGRRVYVDCNWRPVGSSVCGCREPALPADFILQKAF